MSSKLSQLFPHAKFPFICNAPMAGIATPQLAAEVTKAGGIGTLRVI
jgi:nitronate monooxygenase